MDAARQALSVCFVLALLGAALWALRRGVGSSGGLLGRVSLARPAKDKTRSLQLLERVVLTPQHSLHLVRADGREWLLATHPQGCTVVNDNHTTGAAA